MRNVFRASVFVALYLLLSGCGEAAQATPLPVVATTTPLPSPMAATATPFPSQTATAMPTLGYVPPTLIPTIDPKTIPGLLKNSLSIQTVEGMNGHMLRQITGWDHGFGAGMYQYSCSGYDWLDKSHLLLHPQAGQRLQSLVTDAQLPIGVAPQSAVINIDNELIWLPPVSAEAMSGICDWVSWSSELGILINAEVDNGTSTVSTYTYDGRKLANYPGELADISPSGTKILIGENTLIDLQTGKKVTLAWGLEDYHEQILSELFWTSDETRIYRCCYFYADLRTGVSYRFQRSDFQDTNSNHLDPDGLWFYRGGWIRNDSYFLAEWSWVDDGDIRYLPLIDPAKKIFIDVREKAGISEDWSCEETVVSPDERYVWMTGWGKEGEGNYLVDLFTFESQYYPGKVYLHIDWSPNSKFAWLYLSNSGSKTNQYFILSIANKKISPVPINPFYDGYWWHETDDILIYPSEDKNNLISLDPSTMSFRELPFTFQKTANSFSQLAWSPHGDKVVLVAEDGSLWKVDYPKLENLEQLTQPLLDVHELKWSPDGNSIAFTSGSDIYIVDTMK